MARDDCDNHTARCAGALFVFLYRIFYSNFLIYGIMYRGRAKKGAMSMNKQIFTFENITNLVTPIARKYGVKEIYLFGSYARGEATENSDLDFLVFGGEGFKLTLIFAMAEDLRKALQKNVDVFEINEINKDSNFYHTIMKERLLVA